MNILQHRAAMARASLAKARTSQEEADARCELIAIKAELERQLGDVRALAAFKVAKPQTSAGVWKGTTP